MKMGPALDPNPSRPRDTNRGDRSVTGDIVPAPADRPRAWSTLVLVAAVLVAATSAFGPPPVNGLSVAAVVLVVVSLLMRRIEGER